MQSAELKLVHFDTGDVIATSGDDKSITVSGLFDGVEKNAAIAGLIDYPNNSGGISAVVSALNAALGTGTVSGQTKFYGLNDSAGTPIQNLFAISGMTTVIGDKKGAKNDAKSAMYNGTYTWDGSAFRWQSQ